MLSLAVLTYKMSQATPNITKTCNKCTNFIKTIKATTQFVVFLFVHSWEQRKLSELVLIERGGSPRPIDDYITDAPDGLNWVKIGDAPTQGHYITKTAEKIKPEGLSKTRQVQPGDLILSNSMSFGKPYIMAINGCIHDGWLLIRDTNNVFDLTFLCHLLGTTQMLGQYKQFAAGSTVNNLNKELVGNTIVTIPSKPEQKVLGEYFESIDNLITLHQRECLPKTCSLASWFYQQTNRKMTSFWEQRKLGDLFNYYRPDNYIVKSDKYVENAPTPVLTANKGFILGYTNENRSFSQPCIIFDDFTLDSKFVDFPFMVKSSAMKILVLKDEKIDDLIFCYELLNSTKIEVLGHARHYISVVQPTAINIPRYEEQRRISELFQQISNLITLHQCKDFSLKSVFEESKNFISALRKNASWEQRKLGEVAIYRRGSFPQPYGKKEWYDGNGAMSFVQVADVTDEMNLVENTKQKISTLAQPMSVYADKNSVLVTLQGSIGRVAITQYGAFIDRTVLIFEKYKEPINILFWAYIIKQKFIEEAHKAPGGTIKTITKEALSDFDLLLPKYDEQSRVGAFFKQLDNLITLHQRIKINITGDYHDKKDK